MHFQNITIEQLYGHFAALKPGEKIVDVRSPEEFAEAHVPGSMNIPCDLVQARAAELENRTHVYVYCRSGGRAVYAATLLTQSGLRVGCVSEGGMPDWIEKGYEVER